MNFGGKRQRDGGESRGRGFNTSSNYGGGKSEYRSREDRQVDRKQARKDARSAAREARIQAQARWSQERRQQRQQRQEQQATASLSVSSPAASPRKSRSMEDASPRKRRKEEERDYDDYYDDDDDELDETDFVTAASSRSKRLSKSSSKGPSKTASSTKAEKSVTKSVEHKGKKAKVTDLTPSPSSSLSLSSSLLKSGGSSALQRLQRTKRNDVPQRVVQVIHDCFNKLTMMNVMDMVTEVVEVFHEHSGLGTTSRAAMTTCLMDEVDRWGCAETGGEIASVTGAMPYAGLLRGVQLQSSSVVSADMMERLCAMLQGHVERGEEAGGVSAITLLACLYLLCAVDSRLISSLLSELLRQPRDEEDGRSPRFSSSGSVCAASCALSLLRVCGEKLMKECPREMDAAIQTARRAAAAHHVSAAGGSARYGALVQVMTSIVSGHSRAAKRKMEEADAPLETMLHKLRGAVPEAPTRTADQLVRTTHAIVGISWRGMLKENKPPQWWVHGVPDDDEEDDDEQDGDDEEDEDDESDKEDRATARREEIHRLRAVERAVSGQRLHTEQARTVFHCITTATDDLECFTMLMHQDPSFSHFRDVCRVVLQCCVQGTTYNSFFARLLERFVSAKKALAKPLQFSIWDLFTDVRVRAQADLRVNLHLACLLTDLMASDVLTLSVLRGLDLEETNRTIGLMARMIVLRMLVALPPRRLTSLFFGGDGNVAHDFRADTSQLKRSLDKLLELYFDERKATAGNLRWLTLMFDVVAVGTETFDVYAKPEEGGVAAAGGAVMTKDVGMMVALFQKRVQIARKALQQGLL